MNQVYSLQELFANKILKVPDYQRGYAWDRQQWKELLEDIEFLAPEKNHYTGNLVLDHRTETVADKQGQRHEVYHVVARYGLLRRGERLVTFRSECLPKRSVPWNRTD
jgi:hypothetical protein